MFRYVRAIIIAAVIGNVTAPIAAIAADWQWPSQMTLGGFTVTGISGSVRPDGSGSATGMLQIPGAGGNRISLSRSSRGEITGSGNINARAGGVEIQGNFTLAGSGLRGTGTVRCQPKPITDASISVSTGGQFSGRGRLELGRASISVSYSLAGSLDISGATSVRDQVDTPLATYKFEGRVSVEAGSGGRISASASGNVQRVGKLADQVTNYPVSGARVDLSEGTCTVNVGGVSVKFRFF